MRYPSRIGLISDTHGLLRPEAIEALKGSELIIHAGDVGRPEILDVLREIAPVVAVRGNIDTANWASALPPTAMVKCGDVQIYVLHDVHELNGDPGADVIVSGHSHKPAQERRGGVLYLNPGSAGPRRFRLPITVGRLDLARAPLEMDLVDISPHAGSAPRR